MEQPDHGALTATETAASAQAAGAEHEVVADRGGGGGDLAELAALDVGPVAHVAYEHAAELDVGPVGPVAQEPDTRR